MFARRLLPPSKTICTISKRGHISEHGRFLRMLIKTRCWEKIPQKNQQELLKIIRDDIEDADSYESFPFVAMKACCQCFKIGKLAYKSKSRWEQIAYCKHCLLRVILEQIISKTWTIFDHKDMERIIEEWDISPSEYVPLIIKALKKTQNITYYSKDKYFIRTV